MTVLHEYIHYGNCETGFEFPGEDMALHKLCYLKKEMVNGL